MSVKRIIESLLAIAVIVVATFAPLIRWEVFGVASSLSQYDSVVFGLLCILAAGTIFFSITQKEPGIVIRICLTALPVLLAVYVNNRTEGLIGYLPDGTVVHAIREGGYKYMIGLLVAYSLINLIDLIEEFWKKTKINS